MFLTYNFKRLIDLASFLGDKILYRESFHNYVKKEPREKPLYLLVNGPSLNSSLKHIIENKEYETADLMTVNFMVSDERFNILHPLYHTISDPMFYNFPGEEERVEAFFRDINCKVSWPLYLCVPYRFWRDKQWRKKFTNHNLAFIPFNTTTPAYDSLGLMFFAKKGLLGADYGSVIHHGIYTGMLLGYKQIHLFGADHTFFDGLCVNSKNQVCRRTSHFYETDEEEKPISHTYTGVRTPYTMSHFLNENARIFKGHDILRLVADHFNINIINRTPNSMIDSYEREL